MATQYTQADLDRVDAAIADLIAGKRVQQISIAGRTIQYAAGAVSVVLPLLQAERAKIVVGLAAQSNGKRTRSRRVVLNKGL